MEGLQLACIPPSYTVEEAALPFPAMQTSTWRPPSRLWVSPMYDIPPQEAKPPAEQEMEKVSPHASGKCSMPDITKSQRSAVIAI